MKFAWKWWMATGAFLLVAGPVLVSAGPDIGTSLVTVHVPSTQTDNPVFALPLYLLGLLFQLGSVLIIDIAGVLLGLAGLVILIVGLVHWLRSRGKAATAPPLNNPR